MIIYALLNIILCTWNAESEEGGSIDNKSFSGVRASFRGALPKTNVKRFAPEKNGIVGSFYFFVFRNPGVVLHVMNLFFREPCRAVMPVLRGDFGSVRKSVHDIIPAHGSFDDPWAFFWPCGPGARGMEISGCSP